MNISSVEQKRLELNKSLADISSPREKVFVLADYFSSILNLKTQNLIDAYIPEHIETFINNLKKYDCFGIAPENTTKIINTIESLTTVNLTEDFEEQLNHLISLIKQKLELLNNSLEGIQPSEIKSRDITFPVLEKNSGGEYLGSGFLESINVHLKRTKGDQKFILVPSGEDIEERLHRQLIGSWQSAVKKAQDYLRKRIENFEVVIEFDKKIGFTEGNSLGIALTVSFIKEILSYLNATIIITPASSISFTGRMDERGKVTNISEEIIKQKTEIIFYSDVNLFVVPKNEEEAANEKLNELKKEFPYRELKIVGIEDLNDLLNRRNIAEIKKMPLIVRGGKFVRKNWVSVSAILTLSAIISYFVIRDIDTNPVAFRVDGSYVYLLNKNDKVLWQKRAFTDKSQVENPTNLKNQIKIVDIDSDGRNELLITNEDFAKANPDSEFSRISCYNSEGEPNWRYAFKDRVSSERTELPPLYGIMIIDTLTVNGCKNLFLFANNSPSFSSAIFRLDLNSGKRLPGTLWCSGHTCSSMIKDINGDGKEDILCVGLDNGFEDAVLFGFTVDTLTKVRPTKDSYLIRGLPLSDLVTYIRFPKTDYDVYRNYRTPGIHPYGFDDVQNSYYYQFIVDSHMDEYASTVWYQIDYNLKDVNVIIDNRFRVMRDTLVARGKLQLPYTDTPEYVEIIKNKILYYKDGKWVKRNEL